MDRFSAGKTAGENAGSLVNNGQGGLWLKPLGCQSNRQPITTGSVNKLEQDSVKIISGGAHYAAHYAGCALSFKLHLTPYLITNKYAVTLRV